MSPVLCELRWPLAPLLDAAGRLHHNTWTDTDGNKRERYEVYANQVTYLDGPRPKATGDADPAPARAD